MAIREVSASNPIWSRWCIGFWQPEMSVKWHGQRSVPRTINGGGSQGATIGILEYLEQSNSSVYLS